MAYNYFTAAYAIHIHDKIVEISGGITGVKNFGNLDSPLAHIQNDDYYPSFEEKLTHLVFAFNKFHAFNDGNKRTSIAMGAFFMEINGLAPFVDKFILEMENIAVTIADDLIGKDLLLQIVTSLILEIDYSEGLKLEIINALSQVDPDNEQLNIGVEFYKDLF